jgi:hypothetical protein
MSPMRGVRFKVWGKLASRFIGSFKIMEKRGKVACQLGLPLQLLDVHDVFHVSQLKKCLWVLEQHIPMEDLNASEDLSYEEYPAGVFCTGKIQGGQDRVFLFWGGLVNYKTHYGCSWFKPLLWGNSHMSSSLILKINSGYNGVSRELEKFTKWRGEMISCPLPEG